MLFTGCLGFYDRDSGVIELTNNNFDKIVLNSDEVWLIEFYAPWCGHCQQLIPEYKKVAKALKVITVGLLKSVQLRLVDLFLALKVY